MTIRGGAISWAVFEVALPLARPYTEVLAPPVDGERFVELLDGLRELQPLGNSSSSLHLGQRRPGEHLAAQDDAVLALALDLLAAGRGC